MKKGIEFFNKLTESDQKDFLIDYERFHQKEATDYLDNEFDDICSFLINAFDWKDNDEQCMNIIMSEFNIVDLKGEKVEFNSDKDWEKEFKLLTKEQALLKRIYEQKTVTFDDLLKIKKLLEL